MGKGKKIPIGVFCFYIEAAVIVVSFDFSFRERLINVPQHVGGA